MRYQVSSLGSHINTKLLWLIFTFSLTDTIWKDNDRRSGRRQGLLNIKLTELIMKDLHVPTDKLSGLKIRSLLAQKKPLLLLFQLHYEDRINSLENRG